MCSFQVRTLTRAALSGADRICLASSMSTMTSGRAGIRTPNDVIGVGLAKRGLDRVSRPHPRVVAPVEQPDVVDARVAQDQRRAGGGDLPGTTARPLLVGVPFGVAAIEDDRRVVGDSERTQGGFELLRRSALPVDGVLELVRVEVERAGEVILLVLLGDSEVHVEEQEVPARRGFRLVTVEHLPEPVGMDEALVVRETLYGQGLVGRPFRPAGLVRADSCVAQVDEPAPDCRDVARAAVEDDLSAGNDVFRVQKPDDLRVVDARQPRAREDDGSGDVTPSSVPVLAPAVVRMERPDVDDREVAVGKSRVQFSRRDGRTERVLEHLRLICVRLLVECGNDLFET